MKIAVCVKHAVDETELKMGSDGRPILEGAIARISTFDKNAVEEALRLKAALGGEIAAFTVGTPEARKTAKEALAMGADRGTLVVADGDVDSLQTANLIAAALKKTGPFDMIICSEGASDTYTGQVPPMLAELLGVPYVGYARKIEPLAQGFRIERSLEDTVETVEAQTPLVISVVSEINEPRYPTLIQIMQASKKPLEELKESDLGAKPVASARVTSVMAQVSSRKHVMIEGSPEEAAQKLVEALSREGVL